MKQNLTIILVSITALTAFGQGRIIFNNTWSTTTAGVNPLKVNAPVYYDLGVPCDGSSPKQYRAALLGGSTSLVGASIIYDEPYFSSMGTLTMLSSPLTGNAVVTFRTGIAAGYINVSTDYSRDSGLAYGSTGKFQMVAWTGGYADWASAFTAWQNGVGGALVAASDVLVRPVSTGALDINTPDLQGLQSFYFVPEPSAITLAALGAVALLISRRRK